ncbi:Uncharacterised protein [Candidatus Tiddalikarchaeum anstoanum]|nr:Uncharacterised protein [Candidatus Tiddalikarchaeum anstoanum]
MIDKFVKGFETRFGFKPNMPEHAIVDGFKAFEVSKELYDKSFRIKPLSEGLLLATNRGGMVMPTQYFLSLNKDGFKNKIILDEKVSFLFTCGRRILKKSALRMTGRGPLYLVLNTRDEVLGLAQFKEKEYSNLVNIGEYFKENRMDAVDF